jgi:biofilm PGA synthesis protein PgaA
MEPGWTGMSVDNITRSHLETGLPKDPFKITTGYDSFQLDIPIRARAVGIEGQNAFIDLLYQESDLRYYGFSTNLSWLDDGNRSIGSTFYYDQNLLNSPDFKIRMGGEFNYSANSKQNVEYFSPLEGYTFVLNQTFHYIHYALYDRKFLSSVFTRQGLYSQHGFKSYAIYGITFEHAIDISKTFAFFWNATWDRKIYDGESTHVWSNFFGLRKNF